MLTDKNILLGVTGSIAAYKSIYLARLLVEAGANVFPVLTPSATRFVGALSFSAITGNRAITNLWASAEAGEIGHVELAHKADALIIAPATANSIAQIALGLADAPLSAIALSTRAPLLIAPAMEDGMWNHPATQQHIVTLQERGALIAFPTAGALASGRIGQGRMLEPEQLLSLVSKILSPQDLDGYTFTISAGPTQEPLDPVRYLSNYSSGKMGYALAEEAFRRGAQVHLVSGPSHLPRPYGVQFTSVQTTLEMRDAVKGSLQTSDVLIMAAAPADYRPTQLSDSKLKKNASLTSIPLTANPDILSTLSEERKKCFTVGFAAESDNLIENAKRKLEVKELDLIVANDITAPNAGFGGDQNTVTLLRPDSPPVPLATMTKTEVANIILDQIVTFKSRRESGDPHE